MPTNLAPVPTDRDLPDGSDRSGRSPDAGRPSGRRRAVPVVLAVLLVAGLAARVPMLAEQSGDYRAFLLPWYAHLVDAGGFAVWPTRSRTTTRPTSSCSPP